MSDVRSVHQEELPRVTVDVATQPLALPAPTVSHPAAVVEPDCNLVDCSQRPTPPVASVLPTDSAPHPPVVTNM